LLCAVRSLFPLIPFALCVAFLGPANGANGPRPPCESASPLPSFAPPGQRPNYEALKGADWVAPTCTGWISRDGLVVAIAAQFYYGGTTGDLLARFGAISTLLNVRYWSVTENDWRTLITHATALRAPDLSEPRADFTATELENGKDLYFTETDNRLGEPIIYRMRVTARGESLVITTENVSAVQKFMLPLASPGDLQSIHYLTQIAPGTWSYYALARTVEPPLGMFGIVRNESYVNRALALYSHFTNTVVEPLRSSH
jgi:hypothetical protein